MKRALPSKAVTYKHQHLGEMTGSLKITKSLQVLPPHESVFNKVKPKRPCQVQPLIASIEIKAEPSIAIQPV